MKDENKCKELGAIRRFWPGKEPDVVCVLHAEDSKRIADAMGIHLHLEPIIYGMTTSILEDMPSCSCSAGFSQQVNINE